MKIAREHLHREVWAEPMTTVAKRYEVSSNYLARICERLNIPRPGRGYWQQRAAGADVTTDPLPDPGPGDDIEWARDGSVPKRAPMSSTSSQRAWKSSDRPSKHPLLDGARGHFDEVRPGHPKTYVIPRKRNLVDVFVSPGTLDRALKLANELFLFLEDRGHRVLLAPTARDYSRPPVDVREGATPNQPDYDYHRGKWEPAKPTVALVGDVPIGLTIFETSVELDAIHQGGSWVPYVRPGKSASPRRGIAQRDPWVTRHWFPSGRLALRAYAAERVSWERSWRETAVGDLTKNFAEVATTLEGAPPSIKSLIEERKREEARRERDYAEEENRWRREDEARRREEREAARVEQIQEDISAWRLARDIRRFVAEAKQMIVASACTITKGSDLDQRLKWALDHAEKIDPHRSLRATIARTLAERDGGGPGGPQPEPPPAANAYPHDRK